MNFELNGDWLKAAPKHELETKITELNKALRERYPHPGKAKYGKLCRYLNDDQLKIFFDSIPPNWIRERFFFFTCFMFALRVGEALQIKLEDVDAVTGVLAVHSEKKEPGCIEYLPVPVSWLADFEWFREKFAMFLEVKDNFLFYSDRPAQKHWGASYVRRIFRTVCEFPACRDWGLNKTYGPMGQTKDGRRAFLYTVHSLRHSALKRVCDLHGIRKAAEYGRHSSLDSTMIYTQVSVEELREIGDSLNGSLLKPQVFR